MNSCAEMIKKLNRIEERAGYSTFDCLSCKRLGEEDPVLIRSDLNSCIGPDILHDVGLYRMVRGEHASHFS